MGIINRLNSSAFPEGSLSCGPLNSLGLFLIGKGDFRAVECAASAAFLLSNDPLTVSASAAF